MFRIRRIYDDVLPGNRETLRQVREIFTARFPAADPTEMENLGEKLLNPFKSRFRTVLFVDESLQGRVQGFALILHEPVLKFVYLDWIATASGKDGGGLGGAIYDRVRAEAAALGVRGLFMECLPDDPAACPDPAIQKDNKARLAFYESFGARPVVGTEYELPLKPGDVCMPHLVYDGLKTGRPLRRTFARKVVRAILERKYAGMCPPEYVERVVASFSDDPLRLRDFRYVKPEAVAPRLPPRPRERIALVLNEEHAIHHVQERGYVESPARIRTIRNELERTGLFDGVPARHFPDKDLLAVHDPDYVKFLRRACEAMTEGESLYPYVFPIRNRARPPQDLAVLAGYWCMDTFTPLNKNVWPAARSGVDAALTAAREVLAGRRAAYALVRPPGHHAETRTFGGFCYFNNNAVAAQHLSAWGKVAILDLDFHHGNGQQYIFWRRADVLTVSIHGHPRFAYPYFCGFPEEQGEGEGEGVNLNLPLPEKVDGKRYREALDQAVKRIREFRPQFLVLALGLDPAKGDPTGSWSFTSRDFKENGRRVGELGLPTVVVQEGGYRTRTLGKNVVAFFEGFVAGSVQWADSLREPPGPIKGLSLRREVVAADADKVKRLVAATGFFSAEEVDIARELVEERLARGDASDYHFVLAEISGRLAGYTCYGRIPGTKTSFDLYWIAVHPGFQGLGLGRDLSRETERLIKAAGGVKVYADTSQRPQYAATRAFYEGTGWKLETVLADFYAPGDGKAIYSKTLA